MATHLSKIPRINSLVLVEDDFNEKTSKLNTTFAYKGEQVNW